MQIPASKIAPHIMPRSKSSFVGSTNLFGCTVDESSRVDCPVFLSESMLGLFLLGTIYFAEMKRSCADRLTIVYWACRSTYNCDESTILCEDINSYADVLDVSRFSCTSHPDVHGVFDYAEPSGHSR